MESVCFSNAIRNDLQHPNEYIRGATLRFVQKLREPELLEPLVPTVRACLVSSLINGSIYHQSQLISKTFSHSRNIVIPLFARTQSLRSIQSIKPLIILSQTLPNSFKPFWQLNLISLANEMLSSCSSTPVRSERSSTYFRPMIKSLVSMNSCNRLSLNSFEKIVKGRVRVERKT